MNSNQSLELIGATRDLKTEFISSIYDYANRKDIREEYEVENEITDIEELFQILKQKPSDFFYFMGNLL